MAGAMSVLLSLGLLSFLCQASASGTRGYVLTAPKRLLTGSVENLCLTLHNITGNAYVKIHLLYPDSDNQIATLSHNISNGSGNCMKMVIPQTPLTRARLHLMVEFDELYDYRIDSVREIHIQQDSVLTFVQPDKAVYKPGDLVRFRILTLRHSLLPVTQPIPKIWVETPSGIHVAEWINVQTKEGLVQMEFQLSYEPQKGNWKIKLEQDGSKTVHSTTFSVQEYVLPRFRVTVKPPDYILADASYVSWMICARYSYGRPLKGRLQAKVVPIVPAWRQKTKPPVVNLMTELDSSDGCFNFNISGTELGLYDWKMSPNSLLLQASVTEHSTNVTEHSNYTSLIHHQALTIDFVTFSSQYFKPGLPYSGKIKVAQPNDLPASGQEIQVCLKVQAAGEWNRALVACKNFTSDSDGFVDFVVPPQHQNIVLLSFVATAVAYQTKYYSADKRWRVFMEQPSSFFDVHAWYSPSKSYITFLHGSENVVQCNTHHKISVLFTAQNNTALSTFHYLVKSRGDIIYSSSVNQQGIRIGKDYLKGLQNMIGSMDNSEENSVHENTTGLEIRHLSLNLHITPEMSPLSYFILYNIRKDGEVVAATHVVHIDKCLPNIVHSVFSQSQQLPGADAILTVHAAPRSLCALSAVDKRTSFIASSDSLNADRIFRELSKFHIDGSSIPRQHDDWEYCSKKNEETPDSATVASNMELQTPSTTLEPDFWDLRRKRRSSNWGRSKLMVPRLTIYVDAIQAFEEFGAVVLSDLTLETRPCYTPSLSPDGAPRFLSEASIAFFMTDKSSNRDYEASVGYNEHAVEPAVDVRSFFPETWLWEIFHVGNDGVRSIKRQLPHTITEWTSNVVCLSPDKGIGVAPTTNITTFQPFFLDYIVPYSAKRGEIVVLKVVLFNFLSYSIPIKLQVSHTNDVELLSNSSVTGSCINARSTFTHEYRIRASNIGYLNITVTAETDPTYPEMCGPEFLFNRRDTVVKPILIEPEGFPVEITKSSFICSENITQKSVVRWNLEIPQDIVEDSARAEIKVVGDLLAPTLHNLEHLVRMPMGCGEQNMILFVPNLLIINYMSATNQMNLALKQSAMKNLRKGYQRELNYRRTDGSYSAFGDSDPSGSMWLTAFVVKSFAQARKYIFIDENDLKVSIDWIVKKQLENGCFPLVGQVFQKDIKGGLSEESSSSALTAYVLVSLLEAGLPLSPSVTSNALYCLRGDQELDVYSLALTTYAFSLLEERVLATESLRHLMGNALTQQDLLWWEKQGSSGLSLSVEITSYAVLSLLKIGGEDNYINALKAIRWLSLHRNINGGFISTQDTIVALEALAKFAMSMPASATDVTLRVMATEMDHRFHISKQDRMLQKQQYIPVLPTGVVIEAYGHGCALVQASLQYNVKTPSGSDVFELDVETGPVASVDLCTVQRLEVCLRYKLTHQTSNMAVVEVSMVTGYAPNRASLQRLSNEKTTTLKRWEEEINKVNFYFEEVSNKRQCISFMVMQEMEIENPSPANVKLYDYYHPEMTISKRYSTDAGCRNERLPLPQPEISSRNILMDEQAESAATVENTGTEGQQISADTNITTETSTIINELKGLNPQFVNVEHELDFPTGNEGPQPVYTLPQADAWMYIASCPICNNQLLNITSVYCNSSVVYKLIIRRHGSVRLVLDMSPGKPPQRIRKTIILLMELGCKCPQLENVGNHLILLNTKPQAENVAKQEHPTLKLDSDTYILTTPAHTGQPQIVKSARSKCVSGQNNITQT
ncbi:murinoglobulin-1-like isoform X1 [Schistocerca cancellata]|uniref:murinoglobulin-1-like isoform X1 n=2 Tax=Schistocerca cancellata TaxID=274614 RepID=UPI0021198A91|nr:murinoglobulin-1-like isoform X1 [Schistocerca cancellata]